VLDPQSALLTNSEVHDLLLRNPPRPKPKRIGSYATVDLKGFERVREDFEEYISSTTPHIAKYPPPETFVKNVVPRLKAFRLTKPEIFMMINLGIGIARGQPEQQYANDSHNVNSEAVESMEEAAAMEDGVGANGDEEPEKIGEGPEEAYQPSDMELFSCVIEDLDDRFPGEEGQAQIQKLLETMRKEYDRAHSIYASMNGDSNGNTVTMDAP
jgi:hypothetical protein